MKQRITFLMLVVILIVSMLPITAIAAGDDVNGDGYHDYDFAKVQAFLEQESTDTGVKNGEILNAGYDPNNPGTWTGFTFNSASPKRIFNINVFSKQKLAGPLDLGGCTALDTVNCAYNKISTLDVSGCTSLRSITCHQNEMTGIDVSGCTSLYNLDCPNNKLTELHVSDNTSLVTLLCRSNELTSLDVSNNTLLETISCDDNQIMVLDVRTAPALTIFQCTNNPLRQINAVIKGGNISISRAGNGTVGLYFIDDYMMPRFYAEADATASASFVKWTDADGSLLTTNDRYYMTMGNSYDLTANFDKSLVTFNSNGGDTEANPGSANVAMGGKVSAPTTAPTRIGYVFDGWYKESACTNIWDFDTDTVEDNMTLYAKWNPVSVASVTLSSTFETLAIGDTVTLSATVLPNDAAFPEVIWASSDESVATVDAGEVTAVGNGSATITATADGKSGTCAVSVQNVLDFYNAHDVGKVRAFLEQQSAEAGVKNGAKLNPAYDVNDPRTWTGVIWDTSSPKRLQAIDFFNKSLGGSLDLGGCTALETISCPHNQLETLNVSGCSSLLMVVCFNNDLTAIDISGCNVLDWFDCSYNELTSLDVSGYTALTKLDCSHNELTTLVIDTALEYLDCASNALTVLDVRSAIGLTRFDCSYNPLRQMDAVLNGYDISLAAVGNGYVGLDYENDPMEGTTIIANAAPNDGTVFVNWTGSSVSTFGHYHLSDDSNHELTANFDSSLITFDRNGGDTDADPRTAVVARNGKATAPSTAPTREHYALDGWYKESACMNAWDFDTDTVTDNMTLYAKWTLIDYTVTFDSKGGSAVGAATATYNSTIDTPAEPTKAGFIFRGWYETSACDGDAVTFPYTVTGDITLYAKWEASPVPTETPDPTEHKITLTGTLLDQDGNPLAGYTVELHSTPTIVITDSQGRYSFTDVDIEDHTLIVKDTLGATLRTFDVSIDTGDNFVWTDDGSGNIDVTVQSNTAKLEITIEVSDGGDVTIDDVKGLSNPQTGINTRFWWIAVFAVMVAAGGLFLVRQTNKQNCN